MRNKIYPSISSVFFVMLFAFSGKLYAQSALDKELDSTSSRSEKVSATFKSVKLINAHSNETIHKNELDFRVDHRFGDIGGRDGGSSTFFGLDQSTDIRIGFDYGISDRLTAGIARSKGAGLVRQLYEGALKYRLLQQTEDDAMPIGLTVFGSMTASAIKASKDPASAIAYKSFGDRLAYVTQAVIVRKFGNPVSLALIPSYIHRNFLAYNDQNDLFSVGIGGRVRLTKRMAIVFDYFHTFRNADKKAYLEKINGRNFYDPLGVGLEIETGGHVFHLNFTNATAIQESQYMTDTNSSWGKGQFRWGFTMSRRFSLAKK